MSEDTFILVEGLLNWNVSQGCPQNVSSKVMLHLAQPFLMLSATSLQPPSPASKATCSTQTFSPTAQVLPHGSLEVTIQERLKESGIIHKAALHNPKREEICPPVLKPELKNLRWQALATVSYPRNACLGWELEIISPCLAGEHIAGIPMSQKSGKSLLTASTDTKRIVQQKNHNLSSFLYTCSYFSLPVAPCIYLSICIVWCARSAKPQHWDFAVQPWWPRSHKSQQT